MRLFLVSKGTSALVAVSAVEVIFLFYFSAMGMA